MKDLMHLILKKLQVICICKINGYRGERINMKKILKDIENLKTSIKNKKVGVIEALELVKKNSNVNLIGQLIYL